MIFILSSWSKDLETSDKQCLKYNCSYDNSFLKKKKKTQTIGFLFCVRHHTEAFISIFLFAYFTFNQFYGEVVPSHPDRHGE